jgi:hypothetical protein
MVHWSVGPSDVLSESGGGGGDDSESDADFKPVIFKKNK